MEKENNKTTSSNIKKVIKKPVVLKKDEKIKNENKTKVVKKNYAPEKLEVLFTVVPKEKGDIFAAIIQNFEVNTQFILQGSGTANKDILRELGIEDSRKAVIISLIKESNKKDIFNRIEENFKIVKNSKGVSWSVPIDSLIGVLMYRFLTNNRGQGEL